MASEHEQEHDHVQEQDQDQDQEQQVASGPASVTPGQLLRAAREEKQWTTHQVAAMLRLRVSLVEQLEADNYDKIEPTAYVRGYLRMLCKALELDEGQLMAAYQQMGFAEVAPAAINMKSFSKRKTRERNDHRLMLISYAVIGVVIAMAVIWWWQDMQAEGLFGGEDADARSTVVVETVTQPAPVVAPPVEETTPPEADVVDDLFELTEAEPVVEDELQVDEVIDGVIEDSTEETTAAAVAETVRATENPLVDEPLANLHFTFSGECWVKVTDATGREIAIGVKAAGYEMPLTGTPPFDIIVCKPEFVTLIYNDEPVDLSGYRRNRSVSLTLD